MTLFASRFSQTFTASMLIGCAGLSHAVPLTDIPGANATLQSLGVFVDDYLTTNNADSSSYVGLERELFDLCTDYEAEAGRVSANDAQGLADLRELLGYISHEEVGAVGSGFTDTGQDMVGDVIGRMAYLRSGAPMLASNSQMLWQSGGAAGDDFSRLSVYSNFSYGDGSKDRTTNEQGFDFDSQALTFGADYRFSDTFIAGMALGYGQSEVDINGGYGDTSADTYSTTFYGSLYQDSWYLDGSLGYALHSYDNQRYLPASTLPSTTSDQYLNSSTDGDSLSMSLGAGYTSSLYGWNADYSFRLDSVSASVDGYSESGGSLALEVGKQDVDSLQGIIGAQFSKAVSLESGVLVPSLGLAMHQEFDDDTRIVTAQYVFDRFNNQFSFTSDDADKNFFIASLGTSFVMTQGNQMFINLDHLVGLADVSSNTITAGFRMEL